MPPHSEPLPPVSPACTKRAVLCVPVVQASIHDEAMAGIEVVSVGSMRPKGKSYDINVFKVSRCVQFQIL